MEYASTAMLGHTHGQKATPTTVGKEFKVFALRLRYLVEDMSKVPVKAKFSGTVGCFNAHTAAYPEYDWPELAEKFVTSLGLTYNPVTTQIENHDYLCLLLSHLNIISNVIRDLDSDVWLYLSNDYFHEKMKEGEVGSSVMPHKVNPINFENSMANGEIACGLIDSLVNNLSVSRMQRDLSDSSKLRNIGVIIAHSLISMKQTLRGLSKLVVNTDKLNAELEENYEVLTEAVQTIMRKNGYENGYEILKEISRGKILDQESLRLFVSGLDIDQNDREYLMNLTPETYIGLAEKLALDNQR